LGWQFHREEIVVTTAFGSRSFMPTNLREQIYFIVAIVICHGSRPPRQNPQTPAASIDETETCLYTENSVLKNLFITKYPFTTFCYATTKQIRRTVAFHYYINLQEVANSIKNSLSVGQDPPLRAARLETGDNNRCLRSGRDRWMNKSGAQNRRRTDPRLLRDIASGGGHGLQA
jgi:hypothetical protein